MLWNRVYATRLPVQIPSMCSLWTFFVSCPVHCGLDTLCFVIPLFAFSLQIILDSMDSAKFSYLKVVVKKMFVLGSKISDKSMQMEKANYEICRSCAINTTLLNIILYPYLVLLVHMFVRIKHSSRC